MDELRPIEFYEKEAQADLTCPTHSKAPDISGYAIRLGLLRAKWAKYLYQEENASNILSEELSGLYADKFRYYSYDYEYNVDKKDIPILIKGDKDYRESELIIKNQNSKTKFIQEVLNSLNAQSFYLNTAMKHILWQSGEPA